MKKINRTDFLKWSSGTAALPLAGSIYNKAASALHYFSTEDFELLQKLNKANDTQVALLLNTVNKAA